MPVPSKVKILPDTEAIAELEELKVIGKPELAVADKGILPAVSACGLLRLKLMLCATGLKTVKRWLGTKAIVLAEVKLGGLGGLVAMAVQAAPALL